MTISNSCKSLYDVGFWEDLRVTAQDVKGSGIIQPVWGKVGDSGDPVASDYAVDFDKDNGEYGKIAGTTNYEFDNTSFSIAFLLNPKITNNDSQKIIYKAYNCWDIYIDDQKLKIKMFGKDTVECQILPFETNCIVVNWEYVAGDCILEVFNNGVMLAEYNWDSTTSSDRANDIYLMCRRSGRNHLSGVLDELRIFPHILNDTQISEYCNARAGTTDSLTGATPLGVYHFNENTGTTVDNSANTGVDVITLYNTPTWVAGLVWKYETEFRPHAHVQCFGGTGTPVFGLEYSFAKIDNAFGNTTTIYTNSIMGDTTEKNHIMLVFPAIDMTGIDTVSAMIQCTLFRASTDTYTGGVGLLEFDWHYFSDSGGSRQEYYK